jgi:hypothetical protein
MCYKIPAHFQEKLLNFQRYVIHLRKKENCAFKHIGNADEVAVYLDMPRNYTAVAEVASEVKIRSTSYEKQRVTAMLCITVYGLKLPT